MYPKTVPADSLIGVPAPGRYAAVLLVLATLLAAGCGGSDHGGSAPPPPPPPPPPTGIGPAGGTVTGSNGATIVVPAGALASTVDIKITEIVATTANLPSGIERVSAVYELTPHGTTFSAPVTVTFPYDAAAVPAGRDVQIIKTSDAARTVWQTVSGATVNGGSISGPVTGFSDTVAILVPMEPEIIVDPANQTVGEGDSATFSIEADSRGGGLLSYQWQRDGVDISGANGAVYIFENATIADSGAEFTVVVSNTIGSVTSAAATLTVNSVTPWTSIGGAVNSGTPVRYPSIAVDTNNKVYVAYAVGSSGLGGLEGSLRVSTFNGTGWEQVGTDLNAGIGTAPEWPSLRIDSNGMPVVAWVSRDLTSAAINQVIVQNWDGTNWIAKSTNPSGVSGGSSGASAPLLVLSSSNDSEHVAFSEGTCNVFRQWVGSAWEPGIAQACASSNQSGIGLAVNNSGVAFVAGSPPPPPPPAPGGGFTELRNWISVRYRGAGDGGFFSSQLGGAPVNPVIADQIEGAGLAMDNLDRPVIAYLSRDGAGLLTLMVRSWTGVAWLSLGGDLLGADPYVASVPHVRIEAAFGVPAVVWLTGTTSAKSKLTGRAWSSTSQVWQTVPPPHAADESTNIGHFAIALGPDGVPYVAYTERGPDETNPHQGTELRVRTCSNWCLP